MTTDENVSGSLAVDAPDRSQNDDPIDVRVTGAPPDATVEFEATLDAEDGVTWRSAATFTADADGTVDLTRDAPTGGPDPAPADAPTDAPTDDPDGGTWTAAEPMAWLWSMRPADGEVMFPALGGPSYEVTLRAGTADPGGERRETAERTIQRVRWDDEITAREVDREGVVGTLYEPPGDGPHPVVVDLHGSAGRMSDNGPRRYASEGYAALALHYFGDHDALPDELERIPLSTVDAAVDWLRDQPGLAADRVGLVGASRGAELALLLAARRDYAGCVVSYAGSVPWDTPSGEAAWLDHGEEVPHITAEEAPRLEDVDEKPVEDVVPAAETADGPILLLSGGSDPVWQSRRLSEAIAERLRDRGFAHAFDHRTYDDVGHFIGVPYLPLGGMSDLSPEQAVATVRAGEDSWPTVLEYLEDGLE